MHRHTTLLVLLGLVACGDDASPMIDAAMIDAPTIDAPMTDAPIDAPAPEPTIIAEFDGASFQLPESLAFHDGLAYLSFLNGSVVTVAPDGTVTNFGSVAIDPAGSAYGLGITVAPDGSVYLAMAKASGESTFPSGVYRIPATGGAGTEFATHPELFIPNDLDLDDGGNAYITADGRLYRTNGSAAELWIEDPLLASSDGTASAPCGVRTSPFPIGANGIVVETDRVVVGNTEHGSLVTVPILADGSAGSAELLVMDTDLCGIDGLAADGASFLATVLGSQLVRISADATTVIHEGLPLRSPSGVDVGMFGTARQAIVANPDFEAAFGAGGPASAQPNLTAVPL